ncbi:MAG: hypothetical protein CMH31_05650 [Micavibrio sp.]|nr:hypothetical protein [Micavibrio sp.]|tara:strand:- start:664 stop:1413 length:750 start_codon:yes stop_codon:yes gene_type:complete
MILTVITPFADILGDPQEPNMISDADSQLLFGETFEVEKSHGAYVYGRSTLDGYKGFVERGQLIKNGPEANAVINVPLTHLYPDHNFKSRPDIQLSFFSKIKLSGTTENEFSQLSSGEWIFTDHTAKLNNINLNKDLADIASMFLNAPYLYGGRSALGIDCSGLVQAAILGTGAPCPPRDSIDQSKSIGTEVSKDKLQRNDIVFFNGHVGIMVDETNIINATARYMTTLIEPLSELEKAYGDITAIKRL